MSSLLHPGPSAYGDMVQVNEKEILILMEAGIETPYEGIAVMGPIDLSLLLDNDHDMNNFKEETVMRNPSRREFIGSAAVAAVAVGRGVTGSIMGANDQINLAVLGVGQRGLLREAVQFADECRYQDRGFVRYLDGEARPGSGVCKR